MSSCLQVVTTRKDELRLTVTQSCPKFIIKFVYLISEDGYLLVDTDGQIVPLIVNKENE
jgi:hypothetical protein